MDDSTGPLTQARGYRPLTNRSSPAGGRRPRTTMRRRYKLTVALSAKELDWLRDAARAHDYSLAAALRTAALATLATERLRTGRPIFDFERDDGTLGRG
jgi:hypothetical protein